MNQVNYFITDIFYHIDVVLMHSCICNKNVNKNLKRYHYCILILWLHVYNYYDDLYT